MKPCPPGGRKQPPPIVVTRPLPTGPTGGDWGRETPVYSDVAWTKKAVPPIPPRKVPPPPPEPLPVVIIATDGSVGHAPKVGRAAGWAWVSEHGKADAGPLKTGDARVAELAAIAAACTAPEYAGHPLRIMCDSQAAIRVVEGVIAGQPMEGVSKRYTAEIRARLAATGLTIEWVRGHSGHQLNEIADRLALMARRRHQSRLGGVHELAAVIAQREMRDAS